MKIVEIEWNFKIYEKFERIIEDIPDEFRVIASQMIKTKAKEVSKERKANFFEEEDLIDALLAVTKNAFRLLMFQAVGG